LGSDSAGSRTLVSEECAASLREEVGRIATKTGTDVSFLHPQGDTGNALHDAVHPMAAVVIKPAIQRTAAGVSSPPARWSVLYVY
jgi:hypothetical protein